MNGSREGFAAVRATYRLQVHRGFTFRDAHALILYSRNSGSATSTRTAMDFQQVTGPVLAKACEDTAFYRYFRLLALNEVGGNPRRFDITDGAFQRLMQDRARNWPRAMITTARHDTKRGEDARLRLALLSEMPREWGRRVSRWLRLNGRHRSEIAREPVPDRNATSIRLVLG